MNLFGSGINFGFSVQDLTSNTGALISSISPYLLLSLSFIIAQLFINFIYTTIEDRREKDEESDE